MYMRYELEIVEDTFLEFRIEQQTIGSMNMLLDGSGRISGYVATNGYTVKSALSPDIDIKNKTIYLRGIDASHDDDIIYIQFENSEHAKEFRDAAKFAINEAFENYGGHPKNFENLVH